MFHHTLKYHGLKFYRDTTEGRNFNYEEIVKIVNKQFSSRVNMETIARKLEKLHVFNLEMQETSQDGTLEALAKNPMFKPAGFSRVVK